MYIFYDSSSLSSLRSISLVIHNSVNIGFVSLTKRQGCNCVRRRVLLDIFQNTSLLIMGLKKGYRE